MKIWLDTANVSSAYSDGYADSYGRRENSDKDCGDCDVTPFSETTSFFSDTRIGMMCDEVLRQTTPLHIQECQDNRWLACNPIGTGTVVALDAQALALLQHFRAPTTLTEVLGQKKHDMSDAGVEKAVMLFYRTGLIGQDKTAVSPRNPKPETLQAWLHVTNACNLSCGYCYVQKSSEHMTEDVSLQAVEAIFRSAVRQRFKGVRIKYAGGEASLYLPRVIALHRHASRLAREHGIAFSAYMISNGVALSPSAIEQLREHRIDITISLDGVGEYHDRQRPFASGLGSFRYVDRTINRLLSSGVVPYINVTVSQRNLDGLPALMAYILEKDLPFGLSYYRENACSSHLPDLQFADEQMIAAMRVVFRVIASSLPRQRLLGSLIDKADLRMPHHHTCTAGRNYLAINQRGGVAKCHTELQRAITSVHADDPLLDIQNDRSDFQNLPVEEKEGCRTCQWRFWCTGGCPLVTYRATGRNDVRSPNCQIYRALFPDALHLEGLRLLKYEAPVVL